MRSWWSSWDKPPSCSLPTLKRQQYSVSLPPTAQDLREDSTINGDMEVNQPARDHTAHPWLGQSPRFLTPASCIPPERTQHLSIKPEQRTQELHENAKYD